MICIDNLFVALPSISGVVVSMILEILTPVPGKISIFFGEVPIFN